MVRSRWSQVSGRRRRSYELTAAGTAALDASRTGWDEFAMVVSALLGGGRARRRHDDGHGYLAAVAERLDGPRSTRTAILDELRDGLYEACTAWRARGWMRRPRSQRPCVSSGPPAALARGFAGELATARARRIALAYLATGPMVGAPWLLALQPVSGPRSHGPAGPLWTPFPPSRRSSSPSSVD